MSDALAPGFLIAFPHLRDANFRRSVVLLLRQDEQGAMGIVINHESNLLLGELCGDHAIPYAGERAKRVLTGGPVQPEHGIVLFADELGDPADADGERIAEGLNLSASKDTLTRLCNLDRGRFHCYSGYAGWGPGQLEREIGEGSWLVADVDATLVLETPPDEIWRRSLAALGIDPATLVPGSTEEA